MFSRLISSISVVVAFSFFFLQVAQAELYGKSLPETEVVDFAQVMASPSEYLNKEVVTEVVIDKVCQSKGCWFETKTSQGESVRVTFKDYGFFLPKDVGGKKAKMAGALREKTLSVSTQKHFLKDAKASKEEIKAVKEPKKVYQFEASGVQI